VFNRLQTRIVLLFILLFVGVQGLTSFAVYRVSTTNINEQINQQLIYSSDIVRKSLSEDVDQLADGTRLLSSDFGFRTAVATRDYPTILSALHNLVNRIGATSAVLISLDDEIIADTAVESADVLSMFGFPDLVATADEEGHVATFISENSKLYEMVLMPVLAPVPIAWIGVRLEVDDEKAQGTKAILPPGIDISYVLSEEKPGTHAVGRGSLIASTLQDGFRSHLAGVMENSAVDRNVNAPGAAMRFFLGESEFLALSVDFPNRFQNTNVRAIVQYSLDVAYGPYMPLIIALAILIAVGLFALIAGSVFISRSVTQPISALAQSTKRVSEGNYTPVALSKRNDEVQQLATSFNHMIDGISQREAKIIHQAEHDEATGLPNRIGFAKYIDALINQSRDSGEEFCVVEVSIDRFSDIRNTIGFSNSEALIQQIGPRLSALCAECDLIARTSASTFLMALPAIDDEAAYEICHRIIQGFETPFKLGGATIDVLVKIGIVAYPEHGQTTDDLIQRADIACFQSKSLASHVAFYDASKDRNDADRLSLMSELRRALIGDTGEIEFYYQPKVDLTLGKITHVEALIRWVHPEKGFIAPDEFIALAESTGHIHHITLWALEQGIRQASIWQNAGQDIKLAINLSARDLTNRELPQIIANTLAKHDAQVDWLVLEVTESAVMEDPELALGVLNALYAMGLTLSIDDYGTGYSSMAYLKQLPVKEIKIDKSFILNLVENSDDEIIVRSTIELGHNLGLKVTAEGIENQGALDILQKLGCDLAQGYFFSKPLPISEINDFLRHFKLDIK